VSNVHSMINGPSMAIHSILRQKRRSMMLDAG
jgi:hypothetical protein